VTTIDSVAAVREAVGATRTTGKRIGLVPTMGYLHEGHLSLCDLAREHADVVVLSIFVNPLQFGAGEDLDRYPRDLERDRQLAANRGVDILFTPSQDEVYPTGGAAVRVHAPGLDDRLCGRYRPGHFEGVLTVVAKLFNMVVPDLAVFGQKDLQQTTLVRRMVRDLDFDISVIAAPIARASDGLALSSRNSYLDEAGRRAATALYRSLQAAQNAFTAGERSVAALTAGARAILDGEEGVTTQYVELVDVDTLDTPSSARSGHALAVAAFVGGTRLIDNHVLA
jgi:pantoate--beta-alanine ligase